MKITVLGAGAWGTALAKVLRENEHEVCLWDVNATNLASLRSGRNEQFLPGVELPRDFILEPDWNLATVARDCLVFAVPSEFFRATAQRLKDSRAILVSVTKGIEYDTGLTMCRILREIMPHNPVAALSGPSFAAEVASGIPTAVVCASPDHASAQTVQSLFSRPSFRAYWSSDLAGVELGGALKNIIAIAAGINDGYGFGDNSKAALVTRGISEIRRLGVACGAQPETFSGLSGLGDLTLTCFSRQSRNRMMGEQLGRGEKMVDILSSAHKLAEGYPTVKAARRLAQKLNIITPIIDEVYAVCYEGKQPAQAIKDLMNRELKAED